MAPPDVTESVGKQIRLRMTEAGLNSRQLARAVGVNEGRVSRWINDRELPSIRYRGKINEVLGGEPIVYDGKVDDPEVAMLREAYARQTLLLEQALRLLDERERE